MKRLALALFAALIGAGACSTTSVEPNPSARVSVTLDRSVYSPGDTVRGLLHNLSGRTLETSLSLCYARLQRRDELIPDQWVDVPPIGDIICTAQYLALAPHATAAFLRVVPADASGGVYRIIMPAPRAPGDADTESVASIAFVVGAVALGARG
ncbi:MAG TPA: hypothetical protein VN600_07400 [Gemmatimonadaceae bacterium]|nr:hypothetical protein [Gemmatimonadaceae bacterium]